VIIKFCLVFPKIFLLHKVVRDAKKVEKHCSKVRNCTVPTDHLHCEISFSSSCNLPKHWKPRKQGEAI